MDQQQMARDMLARRAGLQFLHGLEDLAAQLPHPDGRTIRITVEVIGTGEQVGSVDVDTTNATDLGFLASRRNTTLRPAPAPAPTATPRPSGRPSLRIVGGAA